MRPLLLTQEEAAQAMGVSVSWLRAHGVPRIELPGRGAKRGTVRYDPEALLEWARRFTA